MKFFWNKNKKQKESNNDGTSTPKLWRKEIIVYQKVGGKNIIWADSENKEDLENSWEDLLEWFEFKLNKQYFRVDGNGFTTMLIRDNIASIMVSLKHVK